MSEPRHIGLREMTFPEPVAAGMNPFVLFSLAYLYRSTNEDVEPIIVRSSDWADGAYGIVDGRHRAVASMIAGRKTVLAVVEE